MKAVTIRHPWTWAICYFGKPLENRDWRPHQLRVGEKFAIHAGKMCSPMEIREAFAGMDMMGVLPEDPSKIPTLAQLRTQESAIVAVATFGGAVGNSERDDQPLIVLPKPVPCRGGRGLWDVPGDVLEKMREQVRKMGS